MSRATGPDHERWEDAAGAYVLGALPPEEAELYVAHLQACAACREEVDELTPAADALPVSVMQMAPPPELKSRIMAEVEREAELLAAAGPQADRPQPRRRQRRRWLSFGLPQLATGLAVLAVGVVLGVGGVALLGGDDSRTVTAQVAPSFSKSAKVELELHDGQATLVASGLPAPPEGRVYQLWLKKPGQPPEPTSALFRPSKDGTATAAVSGLKDADQVLMTAEPDGGSQQPTSAPVLSANLS
jgi:anti-sigma-K factor RskA